MRWLLTFRDLSFYPTEQDAVVSSCLTLNKACLFYHSAALMSNVCNLKNPSLILLTKGRTNFAIIYKFIYTALNFCILFIFFFYILFYILFFYILFLISFSFNAKLIYSGCDKVSTSFPSPLLRQKINVVCLLPRLL